MRSTSISNNVCTLGESLTKEYVIELFSIYRKKKNMHALSKIDMTKVKKIDSAGAAFIGWISGEKEKSGGTLEVFGAAEYIEKFLSDFSGTKRTPDLSKGKSGFFESIGNRFYQSYETYKNMLFLTVEILYWSFTGIFFTKNRRKFSVLEQSSIIGVQSLPLIILLSLILGVILSLQSALQLRQFGANIFIADLMAISMINEMGPMMTAIILAGRSGSAIASEIATMKVSEEIDALKVMGIGPIQYVVVPKFLAITIGMPILVIFSIYVGIGGGALTGIFYLDLAPEIFFNRVISVLLLKDIIRTLIKSTLFAWIIVIIASYFGFAAEGGAAEVGKVTTKAVVYSIILVIIVDAIFSLGFIR